MDSSYLTLSLSNAFLSYTATMLNTVTIHAIRKTPSLSKNLKALLLSQAVSDLGVGLLAQPMYVARLIMESKLNSGTNSSYNAIYIAYLVPTNLFTLATLFLIVVLCAERFICPCDATWTKFECCSYNEHRTTVKWLTLKGCVSLPSWQFTFAWFCWFAICQMVSLYLLLP